eukprot:gene24387-biopygen23890
MAVARRGNGRHSHASSRQPCAKNYDLESLRHSLSYTTPHTHHNLCTRRARAQGTGSRLRLVHRAKDISGPPIAPLVLHSWVAVGLSKREICPRASLSSRWRQIPVLTTREGTAREGGTADTTMIRSFAVCPEMSSNKRPVLCRNGFLRCIAPPAPPRPRRVKTSKSEFPWPGLG